MPGIFTYFTRCSAYQVSTRQLLGLALAAAPLLALAQRPVHPQAVVPTSPGSLGSYASAPPTPTTNKGRSTPPATTFTTARSATLLGAAPGTALVLLDALGRTLATTTAAATACLLLPACLPGGVYVVRAGTQAVRLLTY